MNKYVIYTAVVGNYDEIKQPQVVDNRFDYILFSNDIREKNVGIWQVRPIPYHNPIQTKIARWVKTHPEELLDEYEASLWIDSNIIICSEIVYHQFIDHFDKNTLVATMKHHRRSCVYDELFELLVCRAERERVVLKLGRYLRKNKYPQNNGLCETGVFYRRHNNENVACFDGLWWDCIKEYSRRDQFSVNFALWKTTLSYEYFLSENISVYNSDFFKCNDHADVGQKTKYMVFKHCEGGLVKYYSKHRDNNEKIQKIYFFLYGLHFPEIGAFIIGQFYRMVNFIEWLVV